MMKVALLLVILAAVLGGCLLHIGEQGLRELDTKAKTACYMQFETLDYSRVGSDVYCNVEGKPHKLEVK